jgi:hypothetical protein
LSSPFGFGDDIALICFFGKTKNETFRKGNTMACPTLYPVEQLQNIQVCRLTREELAEVVNRFPPMKDQVVGDSLRRGLLAMKYGLTFCGSAEARCVAFSKENTYVSLRHGHGPLWKALGNKVISTRDDRPMWHGSLNTAWTNETDDDLVSRAVSYYEIDLVNTRARFVAVGGDSGKIREMSASEICSFTPLSTFPEGFAIEEIREAIKMWPSKTEKELYPVEQLQSIQICRLTGEELNEVALLFSDLKDAAHCDELRRNLLDLKYGCPVYSTESTRPSFKFVDANTRVSYQYGHAPYWKAIGNRRFGDRDASVHWEGALACVREGETDDDIICRGLAWQQGAYANSRQCWMLGSNSEYPRRPTVTEFNTLNTLSSLPKGITIEEIRARIAKRTGKTPVTDLKADLVQAITSVQKSNDRLEAVANEILKSTH